MRTKASWQSCSISLRHIDCVCVSVIQRWVLVQFYQISIIRGTLQDNFVATVPQKQSKHCPQQLKCYAILETLWEFLATPMAWCQFRCSTDRVWVLHTAFRPERWKGSEKMPRIFMKTCELGSMVVPGGNAYWASRNQFLNFIMSGAAWKCIL